MLQSMNKFLPPAAINPNSKTSCYLTSRFIIGKMSCAESKQCLMDAILSQYAQSAYMETVEKNPKSFIFRTCRHIYDHENAAVSRPIHATAGIEHGRCYFYKIIGFRLPGPYPVHNPNGDKNLQDSYVHRIFSDLYIPNLQISEACYWLIVDQSTAVHHYRLPFKGIEQRNWTPPRVEARLE